MRKESRGGNTAAWVWFAISTLATAGLFLIPAFIIRPFRYQSPRGFLLALAVRHQAPFFSAITAVAAVAAGWMLWYRVKRWGKAALVAGLLLTLGSASMARLNYFEWMFHPVQQPGFKAATDAKLDASEMVLTLNFNGDSRAYPVSEMAYHHILNDTVGGVPVAVTY